MTTKFHDIVGMLVTYLNQADMDVMVKNNKQVFQEFQDPIPFLVKPEEK